MKTQKTEKINSEVQENEIQRKSFYKIRMAIDLLKIMTEIEILQQLAQNSIALYQSVLTPSCESEAKVFRYMKKLLPGSYVLEISNRKLWFGREIFDSMGRLILKTELPDHESPTYFIKNYRNEFVTWQNADFIRIFSPDLRELSAYKFCEDTTKIQEIEEANVNWAIAEFRSNNIFDSYGAVFPENNSLLYSSVESEL